MAGEIATQHSFSWKPDLEKRIDIQKACKECKEAWHNKWNMSSWPLILVLHEIHHKGHVYTWPWVPHPDITIGTASCLYLLIIRWWNIKLYIVLNWLYQMWCVYYNRITTYTFLHQHITVTATYFCSQRLRSTIWYCCKSSPSSTATGTGPMASSRTTSPWREEVAKSWAWGTKWYASNWAPEDFFFR